MLPLPAPAITWPRRLNLESLHNQLASPPPRLQKFAWEGTCVHEPLLLLCCSVHVRSLLSKNSECQNCILIPTLKHYLGRRDRPPGVLGEGIRTAPRGGGVRRGGEEEPGIERHCRAEEGGKVGSRSKSKDHSTRQHPDEYLNHMESVSKPSEASSLSFK